MLSKISIKHKKSNNILPIFSNIILSLTKASLMIILKKIEFLNLFKVLLFLI
jgi:hypothetical protein